MRTVHEVSRLTGVSVRTLQYYDKIGLLRPSEYTGAGYRLYDDTALETLQQILLFRELEFPLKEIRRILESPDFDRNRALEQQIELLTLKKEHLEHLILFARGIKEAGGKDMDFSAFDTTKLDEYANRAKEQWGKTPQYREFITCHFYTCPDKILRGLGKMYAAGGEFTANIDGAGGSGTGDFVDRAIEAYCNSR